MEEKTDRNFSAKVTRVTCKPTILYYCIVYYTLYILYALNQVHCAPKEYQMDLIKHFVISRKILYSLRDSNSGQFSDTPNLNHFL